MEWIEDFPALAQALDTFGPVAIGGLFVVAAIVIGVRQGMNNRLTYLLSGASIFFFMIAIFVEFPRYVFGTIEGAGPAHSVLFSPQAQGTQILPVYAYSFQPRRNGPRINSFLADSKTEQLEFTISGRDLSEDYVNEFCDASTADVIHCLESPPTTTFRVYFLGPAPSDEEIRIKYDPDLDMAFSYDEDPGFLVALHQRYPEPLGSDDIQVKRELEKSFYERKKETSPGFLNNVFDFVTNTISRILPSSANAQENLQADLKPRLNSTDPQIRRQARIDFGELVAEQPELIETFLASDTATSLERLGTTVALRRAGVSTESLSEKSIRRLLDIGAGADNAAKAQAILYLRGYVSPKLKRVFSEVVVNAIEDKPEAFSRISLEIFYNLADGKRQRYLETTASEDFNAALKYYELAFEKYDLAADKERALFGKALYGKALLTWERWTRTDESSEKLEFGQTVVTRFQDFLTYLEQTSQPYIHEHHILQAKSCITQLSPTCLSDTDAVAPNS